MGLLEMLLAFCKEDVPISFGSNKAQKMLLTETQRVQRVVQALPPSHALRTRRLLDDYPISKGWLRLLHLTRYTE